MHLSLLKRKSVAKSCPVLCNPMNCSLPDSARDSPGRNTGVGCHALLQGIFPTQGLNPGLPQCWSNESTLRMRWPKYWSFSFSIIPSKEIPGLISFRMDWLISLQSKGLQRVFSNTTVQKHQFFGAQPSSQSNSHIHT